MIPTTSQPTSAVYEYISTGRVSAQHPDRVKFFPGFNFVQAYVFISLSQLSTRLTNLCVFCAGYQCKAAMRS